MGLEASNNENKSYENEENSETNKEVGFEKEYYCALNEINKLTNKKWTLKNKKISSLVKKIN